MTGTEVSCSRSTCAALATAAVIAAAGATAASASDSVVTALPGLGVQIAAGINAARAQHGLPRLRPFRPLRLAAELHSFEMARYGFFSHDSHDGTSSAARLARFYPSSGYRRWQVGEALLWYAGRPDAATVVREWLSSSEHRRILLAPGFRDVGVSAVRATGASGAFHGSEVTLVTADFGARTR
jgi:uncharacterized protein YkwD